MKENIQLSFSEAVMRDLLDFTKSEFVLLGDLAKIMGRLPKTLEAWSKQENPAFPKIVRFGEFGWKQVARTDLLKWFIKAGVENAESFATFKQSHFSMREMADAVNMRVEQLYDYVNRGIVKPLDSTASRKVFLLQEVENLKAYIREQHQKEQKQKEHDGKLTERVFKEANRQATERLKNSKEQAAEIESRRQSGIEQQVAAYKKSLGG